MKKSFFIGIILVSFAAMQGYSDKYTKSIINARLKSYDLLIEAKENKPIIPTTLPEILKSLFVSAKEVYVTKKSLPVKLQDTWKEFGINSSNVPVVQQELISDLELLQGSCDSENSFITHMTTDNYGKLDAQECLVTTFGQKRFAEIIAMLEFDLPIINARQQSIKGLVEDSLLREQCFSILQKMKKYEPYVFDFFGKDGLDDSLKTVYPSFMMRMIALDEFPYPVSVSNKLPLISPVSMLSLGVISTIFGIKSGKSEFFFPAGYLMFLGTILLSVEKLFADSIKNLQAKVIGFAQQVRLSKELLKKVRANNIALDGMNDQISFLAGRDVASILQRKGLDASLIKKVEWLQDNLWRGTFNEGKPSYFSSPGHILIANKYLCDPEVRKVYKEAFEMVGEVDCYVALAKKMAAHKDKANAPFCFVDFIENSEKPFMDIKDFWNPFISDDVVVPNDLILNGTDGIRNLIITGPNTSGKSGNTKGFFLNLILAQSFGIAAASECSMTMFRRIITYLNIADDTGNNLSLFKAAAKRANKVVRTLSSLPKNEFGICLMDEPYVGTAHEAALKAVKKNILSINALENCMVIVNTHLKEITELEDSYPSIANYRIGAVTNSETGRIEFTYKFEPGISEISSAEQVVADVEEEDDDFGDDE